MNEFNSDHDDIPYVPFDKIDFSAIATGLKRLPFFEDDLFLGMQAMNVGLVDPVITKYEYDLLREYIRIEGTPVEAALATSALSQMWVFAVYEVLRMWRSRHHEFDKLFKNGGIDSRLAAMKNNEPLNLTVEVRMDQLKRYKEQADYRSAIDDAWIRIERVYRMVELFRINLAKHAAPGKDKVLPRAPGYGRINTWCGAMDYELIDKDGNYTFMNRRNIADALRHCLQPT